jgi:hypothetical protein
MLWECGETSIKAGAPIKILRDQVSFMFALQKSGIPCPILDRYIIRKYRSTFFFYGIVV